MCHVLAALLREVWFLATTTDPSRHELLFPCSSNLLFAGSFASAPETCCGTNFNLWACGLRDETEIRRSLGLGEAFNVVRAVHRSKGLGRKNQRGSRVFKGVIKSLGADLSERTRPHIWASPQSTSGTAAAAQTFPGFFRQTDTFSSVQMECGGGSFKLEKFQCCCILSHADGCPGMSASPTQVKGASPIAVSIYRDRLP